MTSKSAGFVDASLKFEKEAMLQVCTQEASLHCLVHNVAAPLSTHYAS